MTFSFSKQVVDNFSSAIATFDFGDLFYEDYKCDYLYFTDGILKDCSYSNRSGISARGVLGESTSFLYSDQIDDASILKMISDLSSYKQFFGKNYEYSQKQDILEYNRSQSLYHSKNPLLQMDFSKRLKMIQNVDKYIRSKNSSVIQSSISCVLAYQTVHILTEDGRQLSDIRPLVRIGINVTLSNGERSDSGFYGYGGRNEVESLLNEEKLQYAANEALRIGEVNLSSIPAPAGNMPVILGAGWPGVLLHEAVGHGLEGDFIRKKTSVFTDALGTQIANKKVSIVDNGTIAHRRGSINIDDEGNMSQDNLLIENGILKGYMYDRLNARLSGVSATGNGRRESYKHLPMPRMTNTYMLAGEDSFEDMLNAVDQGIYAVNFGGGQVDITSGNFVFTAAEAYKVEKGQITSPIRGVTLIGQGADVMNKVEMVGSDMSLDDGIGTCGKDGQSVPVGVGQPSLMISDITVGGTEL